MSPRSRASLLLSFCLFACNAPPSRGPTTSSGTVTVEKSTPIQTHVELREAGPSLYDLPITLVDRTGTAKPLAAFRGTPVLVTMFYGSCASACPLLTSDLKRIEQQLPAAVRDHVRVLMVSFDQARDTPVALGRMTEECGMDPARWTLASASDDDARSLAGVLGIRYRKLDNGDFFHSSAIVLLDRDGRIRARLDGLGRDAAPIVSFLSASSS
jgi:protein SCO1/2